MSLVGWVCVGVLLLLTVLGTYQWVLALASILPRRRREPGLSGKKSRFLILVPAHDEEYDLPNTLKSLSRLQYPRDKLQIVVVADRCTDSTAVVARTHGVRCLERFSGGAGKGAAIAWAIGELQKDLPEFDGVVVLDADTLADSHLLEAFNNGLIAGHQIQQAYNCVSNPWETPFTRLIAVTSILRNGFFYRGKNRLGFSGMLMGTGMCFSRQVIERHGWTAFSVGEDWEFSVFLLLSGEKIQFNSMARVLAKESRGFRQASPQRLRWASGRYAIASASVRRLLVNGIRPGRLHLFDAALTLLAPNYSTQATLASFAFVTAWVLASDPGWHFLLIWAGLILGSLSAYLTLGIFSSEAPLRTILGILVIPVFLPWRMAIELLGFLGWGRKGWLRTTRSGTLRQETDI